MLGLLAGSLFLLGTNRLAAQSPTTNQPWAYRLLSESTLIDDCPVCGRPTIFSPLRGTFDLRLLGATFIQTSYALENIQFTTLGRPFKITGGGTLNFHGDFALTMTMTLELLVDDGSTSKMCYFTNTTIFPNRTFPMLNLELLQTNGTYIQVLGLQIAAAPIQDLWFSTTNSFTTAGTNYPFPFIRGGDLLSITGRMVKRNADLFTTVGDYPPGPDLGLTAIDVLPGGEIAFALGMPFTGVSLGFMQRGDLLSNRGKILYRNQQLLSAFNPSSTNDAGLDAVHVLSSGEVLFSISSNLESQKLGLKLQRGDLLSSQGRVVYSNQQLLRNFNPTNSTADYGLDSFFIWPNGEVWFSTEDGFQDRNLGPIGSGDLLSDQGYIAFLNSDLVAAFAPTNAPGDLGLDSLFIVTDDTPPTPSGKLSLATDAGTSSAGLSWVSPGHVFRLERADSAAGPFKPLGPISADLSFTNASVISKRPQSFYRLRQW